jgi:DNA-directed RNA polymerase specialized sigma24 family protein
LYQEGFTPADISIAIGCTAANVYYHIHKQRKRLDKQTV